MSWQRIFQAITQHLEKQHSITNPFVLIFDEIQWLAKEGVGFCGSLKEAQITWEQTQSIKIIVCGSSNKFFQNKTGGEETILQGVSTRSAIWLKHILSAKFKPDSVKNGADKKWFCFFCCVPASHTT